MKNEYIPQYKVYQISPSASAEDLQDFLNLKFSEGYRLFTYSGDKLVFECQDLKTN